MDCFLVDFSCDHTMVTYIMVVDLENIFEEPLHWTKNRCGSSCHDLPNAIYQICQIFQMFLSAAFVNIFNKTLLIKLWATLVWQCIGCSSLAVIGRYRIRRLVHSVMLTVHVRTLIEACTRNGCITVVELTHPCNSLFELCVSWRLVLLT